MLRLLIHHLITCTLLIPIAFVTLGCDSKPPVPAEVKSNNVQTTPTSTPPAFRFTDITKSVGLDVVYKNGQEAKQYTILESLGGGVGVLDFDRDGRHDFFFPGGGSFKDRTTVGLASKLVRNIDGTTTLAVTESARCDAIKHYTHGASVADYDADGFSDVLVTGYGGVQLWRNQGDGTFVAAEENAQLNDSLWSSSAGWGDFNNDGILDLYIAHYVNWSFDNNPFCRGRTPDEQDICPPREFSGLPDVLYIGSGDGTFVDASKEWQLRDDGKGLGVVVADVDGNGFVDVYVANDTTNNFLYTNSGNAPFTEVGSISGVATDKIGIPNGSMGVDIIDYNRDGQLDIWVTNYEREDFALYRNEGPASFLHVSDIMGLNVLGGLFVGFGTVCSDVDLDGREDILVSNGHVILYPTISPRAQVPVAMRFDGKRFVRVAFDDSNYLGQPHEGRGLALADFDLDGDLDSIYSNINAPAALVRNDSKSEGSWLQIRLVGTRSARDCIGAEVTVHLGDVKLKRARKGGGSYLSTSQEALAWGLGDAKSIDQVDIRWPSGATASLKNVKANQLLTLVEPQDE